VGPTPARGACHGPETAEAGSGQSSHVAAGTGAGRWAGNTGCRARDAVFSFWPDGAGSRLMAHASVARR
jgi:hypothetical protein